MGFLKKFVALVKGTPDWHEKYNQDMSYLYEALNDMESEAGRSIIPCSAVYDSTNKVHVLTPLNSSQTIPASGMIPVTFIPDADFHAGDKLRFNGQDCGAAYSNTDLAVADGAFRAGFVTSVVFQFVEAGGGTDRSYLAILHNGQALYASNAGKAADAAKLNGLPPEAYIQPQENLLYNGRLIINQSRTTELTTAGYIVDGWRINRAIAKVCGNSISLRWDGINGNNGNIFERIERDALLPNTIYTFSVLVKDMGLLSVTFTTKTEVPNEPVFIAQKRFGDLELSVHDNPECYQFNIYTYSAKESYLKAAKAEPGAYFTGWPVWNYALELAKCQRYYFNTINKDNYAYITVAAVARTNNRLMSIVNAPVSMRIRPTLKIVGKIMVRRYNAEIIKEINENIASINCYSSLPWSLSLDITLTDGTTPFVAGEYYNLIIENMTGNYLEFNANL